MTALAFSTVRQDQWQPDSAAQFRAGTTKIESCFLSSSDQLARALASTGNLSQGLDQLKAVGGSQALEQLGRTLNKLDILSENLGKSFGGLSETMWQVMGKTSEVRQSAKSMAQIIVMIESGAINARILARYLSPPSQAVDAFVHRLAEMSADAQQVQTRINEALSAVTKNSELLRQSTLDLGRQMERDIEPVLDHLAQGVAGRVNQAKANSSLTEEMAQVWDRISACVAHLLTDFQQGDLIRQRWEHVSTILDLARSQNDPALLQLCLLIARAQLHASTDDMGELIKGSSRRSKSLSEDVEAAIRLAQLLYNVQTGQASANLGERLSEVNATLGDAEITYQKIIALAEQLDQASDRIAAEESSIANTAHHIRLSGLNAAIVCARLGAAGRGLRELAMWLRRLTNDCEQASAAIQAGTKDVVGHTNNMQTVQVAEVASQFIELAPLIQSLVASVATYDQSMGKVAGMLAEVRRDVTGSMTSCQSGIEQFQTVQALALALLTDLTRETGMDANHKGAISDSWSGVLDKIRGIYTIETERSIHDAVLAGDPAAYRAKAMEQIKAQDLDDIFF